MLLFVVPGFRKLRRRKKRKTSLNMSSDDSSMDIAPSLITLYDKYASTGTELMSIKETTATRGDTPDRTGKGESIISKPEATEISQVEEDRGAATTSEQGTDAMDGVADTSEDPPDALESVDATPTSTTAEEVIPNPPNQSFLYKSLSSLKSDHSDEEKDLFDMDNTCVKLRSDSCPGILEGDSDLSTSNVSLETEIECTKAPTECKSKSSSLDNKSTSPESKGSGTESRLSLSESKSLEKNGNQPKRKMSPHERTDTNANLKGFQRTLSFGARLARNKFSQFIESNALGKSKSEAASHKKAGEATSANTTTTTAKSKHRLRSDSEPAPFSAIRLDRQRKSSRINPAILTMVEMDNDTLSPGASPISTPPLRVKSEQTSRLSLSYMDQKCRELLETEENYVMDLADVIQGYKKPLEDAFDLISQEDQETLFGNIQEIHDFNNTLLNELQECNNDPVLIAECFLDNEKKFRVYTDYCTNYPSTMEVLIHYTKYEEVAEFLKEHQQYLGHPLPLGAYLLKPVQRVLKYHLLFQDMYKHFNKEEEGYDTIGDALVCMTDIARYINEMKRKHEVSVHVQEIQSQLVGWEGDLMSNGDLVLEDVFRMQGARAERYLYLFDKVLLIGKKREDGLISIKTHIPCSNLMLIESIQKEPLGFNVIPYDNPTIQYTILARNIDQKKLWSHEIKRLILENYGGTIPTKVYDLILRNTMTAKTDSDKEAVQDVDQARDRKERKPKRRQKRRNSEPMGKLIRGQKQVKAAVESMIAKGMKRPELSRWNGRRSSGDVRAETCNTTDESDNESTQAPRRPSSASLSNNTQERRSSLSTGSESIRTPDSKSPDKRPIANNLCQRLSRTSIELDGSVSSTHSEEERDRAVERSNLTRKRESNRDSGIGSMTLSEHAAAEGERDANGSSRRGGPGDRSKTLDESGKKVDPVRKRLGLDGSEEDENAIEELIESMESPDELEALESLPETVDNSSVGHEDAVDLETLPSYIKKFSPSEPFKLRHSNIKGYRPLGARKNGDVWIPMGSESYMRSRSSSYGARPLSADIAMHTPIQKIPLSRSNSDDKHMLAAVSEMYNRSHSDPNMLDTNTEESLDVSQSPGDNSSFSSNENLLETVNNAFKKLGEKYSQFHLSENEGAETESQREPADNRVAAAETELAKATTISFPRQHDTPREQSDPETEPVPPPKTVIKLAREFSRKAKESPRLVVTRHVFSDPLMDRDGTTHDGFSIHEDKDGHAVVRPKTSGKVSSKVETFQMAMTENELWQAPVRGRVRKISDTIYHATPVQTTGSSSDEEKGLKPKCPDTTPSPLSRHGRNRRSVRDVVSRFEKPSPLKNETKVVTPTALGIQQRLRAIRQNAEYQKQSQQDVNSSRIKSLRERRAELEEWVSRPIPRRYNKSEGNIVDTAYSDTGSHYSDEPDGLSSYASSVQSSANASPVHAPRSKLNLPSPIDAPPAATSPQSATEDKEPIIFRSLKERFQELEKAVSKPVPKTCANPKQEIEAEKQSSAKEQRCPTELSQTENQPEIQMEAEDKVEETSSPSPSSETDILKGDIDTDEQNGAEETRLLQSTIVVNLKGGTETARQICVEEERSLSSPVTVSLKEVEEEDNKTSVSPISHQEVHENQQPLPEDKEKRLSAEEEESPEVDGVCKGLESDADSQKQPAVREGRSSSSPIFLEAQSTEGLHRAVSCESNYTDARSEFSTQDSSEDSFHSGYATPSES